MKISKKHTYYVTDNKKWEYGARLIRDDEITRLIPNEWVHKKMKKEGKTFEDALQILINEFIQDNLKVDKFYSGGFLSINYHFEDGYGNFNETKILKYCKNGTVFLDL